MYFFEPVCYFVFFVYCSTTAAGCKLFAVNSSSSSSSSSSSNNNNKGHSLSQEYKCKYPA